MHCQGCTQAHYVDQVLRGVAVETGGYISSTKDSSKRDSSRPTRSTHTSSLANATNSTKPIQHYQICHYTHSLIYILPSKTFTELKTLKTPHSSALCHLDTILILIWPFKKRLLAKQSKQSAEISASDCIIQYRSHTAEIILIHP